MLTTNNVVWYCLTIGFYLLSMGIGAFFCRKMFPGEENWRALFRVEVALSIMGGISVISIYAVHTVFSFIWASSLYFPILKQGIFQAVGTLAFLSWVIIVIVVIGFLTGLELPLLIRIGAAIPGAARTNRVLAADYFGSLFAGIIFPLCLLPHFEVLTIGFLVSLLNFSIVLIILAILKKERTFLNFMGVSIIFILLVTGLSHQKQIGQYFLKKYYYYDYTKKVSDVFGSMAEFPDVERFRTAYQKVDLVRRVSYPSPMTKVLLEAYSEKYSKDPQFPKGYELYLDGSFQFSSDIEEYYHEYFAHIPIILAKHIPRHVLVLGAGDGLLIRELLKYPQIEEITHVELDPKMIELAEKQPVLHSLNKGSVKNPRVHTIIGDAYHYIRHDDKFYDAIYMDFPDATEYMIGKLYSREFYHFIYKRLAQDGFAVFDATGLNAYIFDAAGDHLQVDPEDTYEVYNNSLKAAGFESIVPYNINIEQDNARAREAVIRKIDELLAEGNNHEFIEAYQFMLKVKGKEFVINKMIQSFAISLSQGFIVAAKGGNPLDGQYKDYGIELFVLNEERFKLSFALFEAYSKALKESRINSVMRPTLPEASSAFVIKRPY